MRQVTGMRHRDIAIILVSACIGMLSGCCSGPRAYSYKFDLRIREFPPVTAYFYLATAREKEEHENYPVSKFVLPDDPYQVSVQDRLLTFPLSGERRSWIFKKSDKYWDAQFQRKEFKFKYAVIVANIPASEKGEKFEEGKSDRRRLFLPLDFSKWDDDEITIAINGYPIGLKTYPEPTED